MVCVTGKLTQIIQEFQECLNPSSTELGKSNRNIWEKQLPKMRAGMNVYIAACLPSMWLLLSLFPLYLKGILLKIQYFKFYNDASSVFPILGKCGALYFSLKSHTVKFTLETTHWDSSTTTRTCGAACSEATKAFWRIILLYSSFTPMKKMPLSLQYM